MCVENSHLRTEYLNLNIEIRLTFESVITTLATRPTCTTQLSWGTPTYIIKMFRLEKEKVQLVYVVRCCTGVYPGFFHGEDAKILSIM